jgi:hypothetical protein
MTFCMTYGQLRELSVRVITDAHNDEQKSGDITIALNRFNNVLRDNDLARVFVYEGIGGSGIDTEEKYMSIVDTQVPEEVFSAYFRLRMEVTRENGIDIGSGIRIGGPKN